MSTEATNTKEISDEALNSLLNFAGSDNIIVPDDNTDDTTILSRNKDAASDVELGKNKPATEGDKNKPALTEEEIQAALKLGTDDDETLKNSTKPTTATSDDIDFLQDLVKKGTFLLFEAEEGKNEKPLSEYTKKEKAELVAANLQRIQEEAEAKAPTEFFDALPEKMQMAAKYVLEGGKDLEGMFLSLAQSINTEALDPATEAGQEQIVRRWGASTGLTSEEIEEEVTTLKDIPGALEKKAKVYKPKLDAKQQEIVEKQLRDQEIAREKAAVATAKYRETILTTVKAGELNGLKITPTIQGMIYNGLTNLDYKSVTSGRNTNLLGHLLEQNQIVKPNPALISEVLWLLKDPAAYKEAIKATGSKESAEDTVRRLKTAESQKTIATTLESTQNNANKPRQTIKKPANIFAR